jgi:hypothetical protein
MFTSDNSAANSKQFVSVSDPDQTFKNGLYRYPNPTYIFVLRFTVGFPVSHVFF